jgi:hypothetical protein
MGQTITWIALLGLSAVYYWVRVGRHGGMAGWQRNAFGLRQGEQLAGQWNAYFDFDQSAFEAAIDDLFYMQTRGKWLYVGLTNQSRLVIAHMESAAPPLSYERGQVAITDHAGAAKMEKMAGSVELESAKVLQLTPCNGAPFRLQIATSAAEALRQWGAAH